MPKIVDHIDRRKAILEAGIKAINLGDFTMKTVSDGCGITRTGIYVYYPDKEALTRDIDSNLQQIENKAEVAKYILKHREVEDDKYEKIYKILVG